MLRQLKYYLMCTLTISMACLVTACDDGCEEILRGKKIEKLSIASQYDSEQSDDNTGVEAIHNNNNEDHKSDNDQASQEGDVKQAMVAENEELSESSEPVSLSYSPLEEVNEKNKSRQLLNLTLPRTEWVGDERGMNSKGVLPNVFNPLPAEQKMNLSGRIHWDESEKARELSVEDSIKGAEVELQFYLP